MDSKCYKCGKREKCCNITKTCLGCKKIFCCKCYAWTGRKSLDCYCKDCFEYKCMNKTYNLGTVVESCRRRLPVRDRPYYDNSEYLNDIPFCKTCKKDIENEKSVCKKCSKASDIKYKTCKECDECSCYSCLAITGRKTDKCICKGCYDYKCSKCNGRLSKRYQYFWDITPSDVCKNCFEYTCEECGKRPVSQRRYYANWIMDQPIICRKCTKIPEEERETTKKKNKLLAIQLKREKAKQEFIKMERERIEREKKQKENEERLSVCDDCKARTNLTCIVIDVGLGTAKVICNNCSMQKNN